ncbi:hypothetical protein ACK31Z_18970, partial [Aeromonas dhakensis]|uniref:hypothetical protein n=1 Tax=Aeromonas dhakensis TaxID=196024 RepID=UPI0039861BF3
WDLADDRADISNLLNTQQLDVEDQNGRWVGACWFIEYRAVPRRRPVRTLGGILRTTGQTSAIY